MSGMGDIPATVGSPEPLTYTIVTRNHFHLAAALEEQFRQSNPVGRFAVVVVDADDPYSAVPNWDWLAPVHQAWQPALGDLKFRGPRSLVSGRQVVAEDYWSLAFQYLPLELTCCLKGRVAAALLAAGEQKLLYLDADTRIFDRSENCLSPLLSSGGVLLTPHLRSRLPADGCYPSNVEILRSGSFNAGVLGFVQTTDSSPAIHKFLTWWNTCTARDCVVDPHNGLFVDQRWLDAAPALFPWLGISQHLGLNVGYWNLHEREIRSSSRGWEVQSQIAEGDRFLSSDSADVQPLQVFHFSGASPVDAEGQCSRHRLSRYQNRHSLPTHPRVAELLEAYFDSWFNHDWQHYASLPYAYDALPTGDKIPIAWREAYRQNLCGVQTLGTNPFVTFSSASNQARLQTAIQPQFLKTGRFQFHLDALQARIDRLKRRLDRRPWRRLLQTTRQWKNRWLKKAG